MDILGIGFSELLFIFIIALMVFGPKRLPVMAAKAGKMIRDLRNMSQGFMTEWQREITAAARLEEIEEARKELEKTRQELQQARVNIASQVSGVKSSVHSDLSSVASGEEKIAPPAPVPQKDPMAPPVEASSAEENAASPEPASEEALPADGKSQAPPSIPAPPVLTEQFPDSQPPSADSAVISAEKGKLNE